MKLRSSTKFVLGFVLLLGGAWGGYQLWAESQLRGFEYEAIGPSRVNLIAVDRKSGFRIIVANSMAQLAEGDSGDFGAGDERDPTADDTTDKVMLPTRDMLNAMRGDIPALSRFVMILNRMKENDLPPDRIIWRAEDIDEAIANPGPMREKLEAALNVRLDGTPLEKIDVNALENGIVLDIPVPIKLNVNGKPTTLTARVLEAYKPGFVADVVAAYEKNPNVTNAIIKGNYIEQVEQIKSGKVGKENVAQALQARTSDSRRANLALKPERVLANTDIVLTDAYLRGARYTKNEEDKTRPRYNLHLNLTDDGRMRLWKYSRLKPGFQLLLTVDGVAVAAPKIDSELITNDIEIRKLTDERMANETVQTLKTIQTEANKT